MSLSFFGAAMPTVNAQVRQRELCSWLFDAHSVHEVGAWFMVQSQCPLRKLMLTNRVGRLAASAYWNVLIAAPPKDK